MNSLYEPLLLEIAWEVCHKVGGIYTVIQSKVPYIIERWKEQYCLIGPVEGKEAPVEFQAAQNYDDVYGRLTLAMRAAGWDVKYGYWLVAGKPRVILLNIEQVADKINEIKYAYAQNHQITLNHDELVDKVFAFGHLVMQLIRQLTDGTVTDKKIIAHFHEWMAGTPLAEIKKENIDISTVFTTHATVLGRALATSNLHFYQQLPSVDWQREAEKYGIQAKVGIERLAAQNADIMTTVSRVTDNECEYLLGRKSDLILPNGLNITRFIALHEFQNLHLKHKQKIHEFVMGHFFNNYTFDLDKTLYFFTSGRYEYVNKGYDITLDALNRLNKRLKKINFDKKIVMFFITKRPYHSINPLALQLRSLMQEIRQTCEAIQGQIGDKLFYASVQSEDNNLPNLNNFVDDYWKFRYKKTIQSLKTPYLPMIVTHNLIDDQSDEILQFLRKNEFWNKEEDVVKVVYHPDFIDSTNPLLQLDYHQFVRGCHLGIFPSYYEPWGYTPVECIAYGVPTISSDLSGFGDYAKQNVQGVEENGVCVLRRRNQDYETSVEQLTNYLFDFVKQTRRERIMQRNSVERLAGNFSWENLGRFYIEAYRMAMKK